MIITFKNANFLSDTYPDNTTSCVHGTLSPVHHEASRYESMQNLLLRVLLQNYIILRMKVIHDRFLDKCLIELQ